MILTVIFFEIFDKSSTDINLKESRRQSVLHKSKSLYESQNDEEIGKRDSMLLILSLKK